MKADRLRIYIGFFLGGVFLSAVRGSAYEVVTVTNGGTISGVVLYGGTPLSVRPVEVSKDQEVCGKTEKFDESIVVGNSQGLQNVVVSITNIQKGKGFPETSAFLEQRDCRYMPHIVLTPVGKPLVILNRDGILHSVHAHSEMNPAFNRAQSKFKKEMLETFTQPETIQVTCDVHSWMTGWVVVESHPYFTVTGADGSFALTRIPPGRYALKFWHEVLGERALLVVVGGVGTVEVEVYFGG